MKRKVNYVKLAKEIIDDIFLDKKNYLLSVFLRDIDFDEFKNVAIKVFGGLSYKGWENLDVLLDSSYIIVNENLHKFYKHLVKAIFKESQDLFNEQKIIRFLMYLKYMNDEILNRLLENPYTRKEFLNESKSGLIFLPSASFDFAIKEKIIFDNIQKGKKVGIINSFLEDLLSKNYKSDIIEEDIYRKIETYFTEYLKTKGYSPLDEQIKTIRSVIENSFNVIEGVPGSSKTFTGAFSVILSGVYTVKVSQKPYTGLITGHTYKSVEESLKNFLEILKNPVTKKLLHMLDIKKICLNFCVSVSRLNEYQKYEIQTDESVEVIVKNQLPEKPEEGWDLYFLFAPLAMFMPYREEMDKSLWKYYKETKNKVLNKIREKNFKAGYNLLRRIKYEEILGFQEKIDILFNHIHIEEGSQFSAVSLITLVNSILGKTLDGYVEFYKKGRFTFSGDPKQLSPIYSYKTVSRNMMRIGAFYNLFTFFDGSNMAKIRLKTSLRNPEYVVDIIKPLYKEIESYSTGVGKSLDIKENSFLYEILKDFRGLGRISYEIVTEEPYKNRLTDENLIEGYISKLIYETYNSNPKGEKVFFLTPFRKQELSLLKMGISEVGTVDKMQGRESNLVVYLTTIHDKEYLSKVMPFIIIPNRMNVALTRTKGHFLLIHSKNLESELFSYYHNVKETDEFLLGYILLKNKVIDKNKILDLLVEYDLNKGNFIIQRYIEKTSNKEHTVYLPILIENGYLKFPKQVSLNKKPVSRNYVKIEFYSKSLKK